MSDYKQFSISQSEIFKKHHTPLQEKLYLTPATLTYTCPFLTIRKKEPAMWGKQMMKLFDKLKGWAFADKGFINGEATEQLLQKGLHLLTGIRGNINQFKRVMRFSGLEPCTN